MDTANVYMPAPPDYQVLCQKLRSHRISEKEEADD